MDQGIRNYLVVTGGYWGFTLTDGAIRMLVVLYFHQLGYSPMQVAMLFLFYEFFGIVTNLVGGWLGARIGLNLTMHIGMAMQIVALAMLTVPDAWLTVPYVMFAQALSGVAKDLNKMSAKASVKLMLPDAARGQMFRWVARLTGSKNSLKGGGFFLGALMLDLIGYRATLAWLAGGLALILLITLVLLPGQLGRTSSKPRFREIFSKTAKVNWLSAARFFLFGARDVWFVVGLPVFLTGVVGWSFTRVGAFLALWVIGYGLIQAVAPNALKRLHAGDGPDGKTARTLVFVLAGVPAAIAAGLQLDYDPVPVLIAGLALFAVVFALNSALHSYLIIAWSDREKVSMNVGFYYMANAGGRLLGTVLSGMAYQLWGLAGCLWWSTLFVLLAGVLTLPLARRAV